MSDVERILHFSSQLEMTLERELGASGQGLHQKTSSVERKLTPRLVKRLRYIASVRNKAAHETATFSLEDPETFFSTCKETVAELNARIEQIRSKPPEQSGDRLTWIGLAVGVVVVLVGAGKMFNWGASEADSASQVSATEVRVNADRDSREPAKRKNGDVVQISAVQDGLVELAGMTLQKNVDDLDQSPSLVISATVTNRWTKALASLDTVADVYVPQDKRWIRGVKQSVYFPSTGLAPGGKTHAQFVLGGYFGDYRLQVPDVVNAVSLKVVLRVTGAKDGIGDQVGPTGAVVSAE